MVTTAPPATSLSHAREAVAAFIRARDRQLKEVRGETRTKREALDFLRRLYVRLTDDYLRKPGTTYSDWLDHGPQREWHEVLTAADDDAVWDRLLERFDAREVDRG